MECKVWCLERYARLSTGSTIQALTSSDGWEYFDNKSEKLELTVTSSNHFLIHYGKRQMESMSLTGTASATKGVSKGDSMMVICKIQNTTHRFRVKFSSTAEETGEVCCRKCVERLSKHFPIKVPTENPSQTLGGSQQIAKPPTSTSRPELEGDVTLGQLAQAITDPSGPQLPKVCYHQEDLSGMDLNTAIKLCLTDPQFPAFVGRVEAELEKIMSE